MANFLRFSPIIYLKHAMSSHSRTCSENLDPRVTPEDDERGEVTRQARG